MPRTVRGVLVKRVSPCSDGPLDVSWVPAGPGPLPFGEIRLRWEPARAPGWDVTAHLGLETGEVLLASWPAAPDDWPSLVRPTLYEVLGLCAALKTAARALDLACR